MYNIIEKKHDVFEEKNEKLLLRFGLYEMGSTDITLTIE